MFKIVTLVVTVGVFWMRWFSFRVSWLFGMWVSLFYKMFGRYAGTLLVSSVSNMMSMRWFRMCGASFIAAVVVRVFLNRIDSFNVWWLRFG